MKIVLLTADDILNEYQSNPENLKKIIKNININDLRYNKLRLALLDQPLLFNFFVTHNNTSINTIFNLIEMSNTKFLDLPNNANWLMQNFPSIAYNLLFNELDNSVSDHIKHNILDAVQMVYTQIINLDNITNLKPFVFRDLSFINTDNHALIEKIKKIKTPDKNIYELIEPLNKNCKTFAEWIDQFNVLFNLNNPIKLFNNKDVEFNYISHSLECRYAFTSNNNYFLNRFISHILQAPTILFMDNDTIIKIPFNCNFLFIVRDVFNAFLTNEDVKIKNNAKLGYVTYRENKIPYKYYYDVEELLPLISEIYKDISGCNIHEIRMLIKTLQLKDIDQFLPPFKRNIEIKNMEWTDS